MKKNKFDEDIIFVESTAAAISLKNFWTKMASTYNCIHVSMSEKHLIIKPIKAIAWLIYLSRLDLYHVIPINSIISFEEEGDSAGYKKIRISFNHEKNGQKEIMLFLRKSDEFIRKLKQLIIK
jgi:hypothetical protein